MDAGVRLGRRLDDRLFILLGLDTKKFFGLPRLLGEALLVDDERRIFLFLRFRLFQLGRCRHRRRLLSPLPRSFVGGPVFFESFGVPVVAGAVVEGVAGEQREDDEDGDAAREAS